MKTATVRGALALAVLVLVGSAPSQALPFFTNSHLYDAFGGPTGAVTIDVAVEDFGSFFLWTYTVHNNAFDPNPGTSNGFSGFELDLPAAVPDITNVTSPSPGWIIDCCSGAPVEWDITNSVGLGIMPGEVGVFSFETLPRLITVSTGWFHTWQGFQTDISYYLDTPGETGPEVPDVLSPPTNVPEPATLTLTALGLVGLLSRRRR